MTCDRFSPSSLIRSMGSFEVLGGSAFRAAAEAGWLGRAEVAACWARKARAGTRHVTPRRMVILSSRRMAADLRKDSVYREESGWGFRTPDRIPGGEGNSGRSEHCMMS